jgi:hypothetical protein
MLHNRYVYRLNIIFSRAAAKRIFVWEHTRRTTGENEGEEKLDVGAAASSSSNTSMNKK